MGAFIDLTGQRFERLLVLERTERTDKYGAAYWLCACDCGQRTVVRGSKLREAPGQKSCGCLSRENLSLGGPARVTHGHSVNRGNYSPTYRSWRAMRTRCLNPADHSFTRYGALGVSICERWNDFANFLTDMGERPPGTSIDRIDNSKGYEPGNCRWATSREQILNRSMSIWVELDGERKCLKDWCIAFGINRQTVSSRIKRGWPIEQALKQATRISAIRSSGTSGSKSDE